jgi:L-lactate dehydrogenase (cytochrome)
MSASRSRSVLAGTVSMATPGASSCTASSTLGSSTIWPTSAMYRRNRRSERAVSKSGCCARVLRMRSMESFSGDAISSALGVGIMPSGVRTNSGSPRAERRRFRALLTADCVSPRCAAARVVLRDSSTASKTSRRFRSKRRELIAGIVRTGRSPPPRGQTPMLRRPAPTTARDKPRADPATMDLAMAPSLLCLDDFETAARRQLPWPLFNYIAGAAETNASFAQNRAAFQDHALVPRVLVDVTARSTAAALFGHRWDAPFGIAPMGLCALTAYRGDLVLATAAARMNVPMVLSGASLIRMEDIARANPNAWFQAYLPGDEAVIEPLLARVQAAGFRVLVVTVDVPVPANRENNVRAGFSVPLRPSVRLAWQGLSHPRWLFGTFLRTLARHGMPHFENGSAQRGSPILSAHVQRDLSGLGRFTWRHLALVRKLWPGTLVVKGVLDARDARTAVEHGADGLVVSNHGGRQLDGAVAPLRVLPQVVQACPGVPVMLDSGVRRGTDVLKALALGAAFVFAGRPFAFAAAVGGEAGVLHALALLQQEVARDMGLLGITSLEQLEAGCLASAC